MKSLIRQPINKLLLFYMLTLPALANASLLVVANVDKPISLSKSEVKAIFMGGATSYDLNAVALTAENKTRAMFNARIIGMTESRIQSYWAQMRFSGRQKPPREFDNEEQLINYLVKHKGAVAYVSSDVELKAGIVILYRSED
nr:hypothetical protein [uncultured Glaciecola sp.]